ncbi:hypothetical protein V6N12_009573 [Hibiscus sabdariffa]|uniref:Uncharacterized protein n=1 Tax=Hibiscus sabdariffa TaxID=183260 RepID=A0ABR2B2B8_9ROSI
MTRYSYWNWEKNDVQKHDLRSISEELVITEDAENGGTSNWFDVADTNDADEVIKTKSLASVYERCNLVFAEPTSFDDAAKVPEWIDAMKWWEDLLLCLTGTASRNHVLTIGQSGFMRLCVSICVSDEINAIITGLKVFVGAGHCGKPELSVESFSGVVINWINNPSSRPWSLWSSLVEVDSLSNKIGSVQFVQENEIVSGMTFWSAKYGLGRDTPFKAWW